MCSSRGLRLRLEMEQKTIVVTTIIGSSRPGHVLQIMLDLLCLFALSLSLCSFHACVHPSELLSLRFSVAPLISEAFLFPHYFVASLSLTNYSNPLFSVLTCTFSL